MAPTKLHRGRVLAILFAGVLMGALDIAIVGPALPALQAAFLVDSRALSWVFGIYILFYILGAPLMAKLSDRYGRRPIYIADVGLFAAGSAMVVFFAIVSSSADWACSASLWCRRHFASRECCGRRCFSEGEKRKRPGHDWRCVRIGFPLGSFIGGAFTPVELALTVPYKLALSRSNYLGKYEGATSPPRYITETP